MITFAILRKKRYRTSLLVVVFVIIMALATLIDGSYEEYGQGTKSRLGLKSSFTFPVREISGMFLFPPKGRSGASRVFLIGDTEASLGTGYWDGQNIVRTEIIDFSQAILGKWGICHSRKIKGCLEYRDMITSQWEAVGSDGTGRPFLLHEQLGTVFVLDTEKNSIESLINLESFSMEENRHRYRSTVNKENALGEGLVLLKNGHMLVIRERYEPAFIEFGPAGSLPEGYRKGLALGAQGVYPLPSEQFTLYPLKIWKIPGRFSSCDLSEISQGPDHSLYALSQQCRWIARLPELRPETSQAEFSSVWSLPSIITKAEAFIVPDEHHFVVAEDKKSIKKANIFVLSRPEAAPVASPFFQSTGTK